MQESTMPVHYSLAIFICRLEVSVIHGALIYIHNIMRGKVWY